MSTRRPGDLFTPPPPKSPGDAARFLAPGRWLRFVKAGGLSWAPRTRPRRMTTIFDSGSWISTVWDAGKATTESTGMMGALQGASSTKYSPGSIKAFMAGQQNNAAALAAISQTGVTSVTALAIQAGDLAMQKRLQARMAETAKHNVPMLPAAPLGDSTIYFENGSVLDTVKNVLTLSNGKKIDAITGADWVDPASIIQLGNGSYLDTANSILTMANGTRINTITGLIV